MKKPEDDGLVQGRLRIDLTLPLDDELDMIAGPRRNLIIIEKPGMLVIEGLSLRFWEAEGDLLNRMKDHAESD